MNYELHSDSERFKELAAKQSVLNNPFEILKEAINDYQLGTITNYLPHVNDGALSVSVQHAGYKAIESKDFRVIDLLIQLQIKVSGPTILNILYHQFNPIFLKLTNDNIPDILNDAVYQYISKEHITHYLDSVSFYLNNFNHETLLNFLIATKKYVPDNHPMFPHIKKTISLINLKDI